MPGEPDIAQDKIVSDNPVPGEIGYTALRIKFLKQEIKRTLIKNCDCGDHQLEFLLKRL